jgi:hypothetical protein
MSSTKRSPRRRHLLLAVGVPLALFAAACSNSGSDSATSTTSGGSTSGGSTSGSSPGTTAEVDTSQKVEITGVPGVTDDAINYSVLATETNNPLGTCVMDCYLDGIEAYFNWRNSEGGIWGRELKASNIVDDEFSNNQVKALEIVTAEDTFATFSATNVPTGWPDLTEAGIPVYAWMINPVAMNGVETIWANREVACAGCTRRATAYVAELSDATKVASLGYGISEVSKECAAANAQSIEKYSSDIGGPTVAYTNDELAFGLPNGVGPEVTAMKNAGVDMIFACMDLNGMKTLGQELERQGMQDVTLFHSNSYDSAFVGDAGGVFEGDYVQAAARPFEADPGSSNLQAFLDQMEEDGSTVTEMAMVGWINADLAYEGLKAAGPEFDRQKVIDATNGFTNYTATGLTQPVDWSRQHIIPTQEDPSTNGPKWDCISLVQIKGAEFEVVGDTAKPWACWPGDTDEWSEPVAMDFPTS